ncbi:MAG: DUF3293 domain-containing protein [Ilumatobacteraceae bacterium]
MTTISIPTEEFQRAWALYQFVTTDERSPLGELRLRSDGRRRTWSGCDPRLGMTITGGSDQQVYDIGLSWALLAAVDVASWSDDDLTLRLDDEHDVAIVHLEGPGGGVTMSRHDRPYPSITGLGPDADTAAGTATVAVTALQYLTRTVRWKREWDAEGKRPDDHECWLTFENDSVVVSTHSDQLGRMSVRLRARGSDSTVDAFVDPDLLAHLVEHMPPDDDVTIRLSRAPGDPIVFDGPGWQAYLMPRTTPHDRLVRNLEDLLEATLGPVARIQDADGDYPLRRHGLPVYGRIHTDEDGTVWFRVFAVLAGGIEPGPEVFRELNDLNSNGRYARLFFVGGQILAEVDLLATTLDADELIEAIERITTIASEVIPTLTIVLGGSVTPNDADRRWAAYRTTIVEAEVVPGTNVALNGPGATEQWPFPGPVHVITGWNPAGRAEVGEDWNRSVNRQIAVDVTERGGRFVDGIGRSPSGDHVEESLVVRGLDRESVRTMGRRASQDAIFEIDTDSVHLISCSDGRVETWPRLA